MDNSCSAKHARILVVDDDPSMLAILKTVFENESWRVSTATSYNSMLELTKQFYFDLVVLDVFLGEESGFDCLEYLVSEQPFTKVVVVTGRETIDLAVHAMELGAVTFVTKTSGVDKIRSVVKEKLTYVTHDVDIDHSNIVEKTGILGNSDAMLRLRDKIEQVKDVQTTVLILGETGTGKELVARALHNLSARASARFEAVNCSAIPETLLEAELFGYKKGSFTDAKTDRVGLFQICSEGTLFLDEIGDMPLALQAKVLRVLQEREIRPLGSDRTYRVNTRVVAATHTNLKEKVAIGAFREDLYYRLSVLPIEVPSLRDRSEDISLLIENFLKEFSKLFNRNIKSPSHDLVARIKAYRWPGNVRELKNAIERAVILSRNGELSIEHILPHKNMQIGATSSLAPNNSAIGSFMDSFADTSVATLPFGDAKVEFEKKYLMDLLYAAKGNISQVARLAGKFRSDIYRLMEKYQINQNDFR